MPGDLAAVGEKNGTTLGKKGDCEGGQTGTLGVSVIIVKQIDS